MINSLKSIFSLSKLIWFYTSRITGRHYKTYYQKTDQGFSYPFGQNTEGDTVEQRQSVVKAAIVADFAAPNLITFSPEKVRP